MTVSYAVPTFEAALGELEGIVQQLESGRVSLEESVSAYERGMALHELCETHLKNAQMKIQKVVRNEGGTLEKTDLDP